jgi:hypothetical protein
MKKPAKGLRIDTTTTATKTKQNLNRLPRHFSVIMIHLPSDNVHVVSPFHQTPLLHLEVLLQATRCFNLLRTRLNIIAAAAAG